MKTKIKFNLIFFAILYQIPFNDLCGQNFWTHGWKNVTTRVSYVPTSVSNE